jgi:hypothetical protein
MLGGLNLTERSGGRAASSTSKKCTAQAHTWCYSAIRGRSQIVRTHRISHNNTTYDELVRSQHVNGSGSSFKGSTGKGNELIRLHSRADAWTAQCVKGAVAHAPDFREGGGLEKGSVAPLDELNARSRGDLDRRVGGRGNGGHGDCRKGRSIKFHEF